MKILKTEVFKSRLKKPAKLLKVRRALVEELQELDDEEGEGREEEPVNDSPVVEGRLLRHGCQKEKTEPSIRGSRQRA